VAAFLAVLGASIALGPTLAEAQALSYDQVYQLAAEAIGPGPGAHYATRIARCESDHVASAHSAGWDRFFRVNYSHVGLWQIESNIWGATAWRRFGGSLWEPRVNAGMMGLILGEQGWGAWPYCSRNA
jgi:hypothetical protein